MAVAARGQHAHDHVPQPPRDRRERLRLPLDEVEVDEQVTGPGLVRGALLVGGVHRPRLLVIAGGVPEELLVRESLQSRAQQVLPVPLQLLDGG